MDFLISKKESINNSISESLSSERKTLKITVRDKLRLLNSELIRFKNSGISYRIIRALLLERAALNVSEQTLREHCQQELGFQKRISSKINTETSAKNDFPHNNVNQRCVVKPEKNNLY